MKRFTLLSGLLLNVLSSFCQEESWDVYMAQYEKGPGSTVINMSLKEVAPVKQMAYLLSTGVTLIKCSTDGLPVKEEFDMLYKISDSIKHIVDSKTKNKFVGTFSYQCERNDYYYLSDTIGIRKLLETAYKKTFPKYKYTINIKTDEQWEVYLAFLYPNDETFEYMSNQKVVLKLTEQGDDLAKPRQVDHWLYFKTVTDRDKFIAYALKEKFKVEDKQFNKDLQLNYKLRISRIDNVDLGSISKTTIELRKKAKELNGVYDGWETFVVIGN